MGTTPREHFRSIRPKRIGRLENHLGVVSLLCSGPGKPSSTISRDDLYCLSIGNRSLQEPECGALDRKKPHFPMTIPRGEKKWTLRLGIGGERMPQRPPNLGATVMPFHGFLEERLKELWAKCHQASVNHLLQWTYKECLSSEIAWTQIAPCQDFPAQMVLSDRHVYVSSIHCIRKQLSFPMPPILGYSSSQPHNWRTARP